jgi:hypothetical protein
MSAKTSAPVPSSSVRQRRSRTAQRCIVRVTRPAAFDPVKAAERRRVAVAALADALVSAYDRDEDNVENDAEPETAVQNADSRTPTRS